METEGPQLAANTIGAGFVITPDNTVGIIVMLGEQEDGEDHKELASIMLSPEVAEMIVVKLQGLLADAEVAEEAVTSMGHEAATEYLTNWAKRNSAGLN